MENELKYKKNFNAFIVPVVSIAAFLLLMFGAGYAYYTTSTAMNTAYGNIVMPARQSMSCTKTDGSVTPAYSTMWENKNGTIAGNTQAKITCNCSGGGTCSFTVTAKNATTWNPVTAGEVTVDISGSGCTGVANRNVSSSGVSTTCSVASGSQVTVNADFHFWNVNNNQDNRAGETFKFSLATSGATFS